MQPSNILQHQLYTNVLSISNYHSNYPIAPLRSRPHLRQGLLLSHRRWEPLDISLQRPSLKERKEGKEEGKIEKKKEKKKKKLFSLDFGSWVFTVNIAQ